MTQKVSQLCYLKGHYAVAIIASCSLFNRWLLINIL